MEEHVSLLNVGSPFGYMPRSDIVGSSGSTMSNFLINCQTDFQTGWTSLQSHQQWRSITLSPHPCYHLLPPEFFILAILTGIGWNLRSFAILWGSIYQFLCLPHKLLVFCLGSIIQCPCAQGSSSFSFLFLSLDLVLHGGPWSTWTWVLYKEVWMEQFAFFLMLTTSWNRSSCWKFVLFPLKGFNSFIKDQVTIGLWVHFWVFNSIPWINLPVVVPIPWNFYYNCSVVQLEVRYGDSTGISFIVENSFHYSGLLLFPLNLQVDLSNSM